MCLLAIFCWGERITTAKETHVAHGAVISRLDVVFASVAGVDKCIFSLIVKFIQEDHCGEFGSSKRGELAVFLSGHGQEGVPAIQQIAGLNGVRVLDRGQVCCGLKGVEPDHKEYLQTNISFKRISDNVHFTTHAHNEKGNSHLDAFPSSETTSETSRFHREASSTSCCSSSSSCFCWPSCCGHSSAPSSSLHPVDTKSKRINHV